jgi:hypothetical protein
LSPHITRNEERTLKVIFSFAISLLTVFPALAGDPADTVNLAPPQYRQLLDRQLSRAGNNRTELLAALRAAKPAQREALAVLMSYMPESDLTSLGKDFLLSNVEYAAKARAQSPWGKVVSDELFFNYVLPYASLSERRDSWRKDFYERFAAKAWKCRTPTEAALLLNKEAFAQLNVQFHPTKRPKTEQSPYESADAGYASCTGSSILLINACRAVGIPARLVGSPAWTDKTANHSWVEIWDRQWKPIDAAMSGPFDEEWIKSTVAKIDPKRREHSIFAVSFLPAKAWFPRIWNPDDHGVPADDVTRFYTDRRPATFRVVNHPGGNVVPARISVRLAGRLVAEDSVTESLVVFLPSGHTYDVEATATGSQVQVKQQVWLADDDDSDPIELPMEAYAGDPALPIADAMP